jgi:hypothetical protein
MPDAPRTFAPNHPDVAHETFEDEVILIHFQTGRYFRLDAAGRVAWSEVERGATTESIASALGRRFEATPDALASAASSFLDALLAESLVVERATPAGAANGATRPPGPVPAPTASRTPLVSPRLEVFTDLQDLLLLDPIHDTDEAGWPHAKP